MTVLLNRMMGRYDLISIAGSFEMHYDMLYNSKGEITQGRNSKNMMAGIHASIFNKDI